MATQKINGPALFLAAVLLLAGAPAAGNLICGSGSAGSCPTTAANCTGACSFPTCGCTVNASQTIDNNTVYTFKNLTINSGITVTVSTRATGGAGGASSSSPGGNGSSDSVPYGGNGGAGGDNGHNGAGGSAGTIAGGGGGGGGTDSSADGGKGGNNGGGGGGGGGSAAGAGGAGGNGGGAVTFIASSFIAITGTLQANGTSGADGADSIATSGSGGGAGGGGGNFNLYSPNVTISGTVKVIGGNGGNGGNGGGLLWFIDGGGGGGGGGGGYVNISTTSYTVTGTINASGGSPGAGGSSSLFGSDGSPGAAGSAGTLMTLILAPNAPANGTTGLDLAVSMNFTTYSSHNSTFACNITLDGNSSAYYNSSTRNNTLTNYPATDLANGTHYWNATCATGPQTYTSATYTFIVVDRPPAVTLSYPPDNYYNDTQQFVNITFNASVSDTDRSGLKNCSIWTNYTGTWLLNQTQTVLGASNVTNFTLTNLNNKTFAWNVQCFDNRSLSGWASANRTVKLNWTLAEYPPTVSLSYPQDNYFYNATQFVNITFNASVSDNDTTGLINCSIWTNYTGTWLLNQTQTVLGASNVTNFTLTNLNNKTFAWNIQCYDNASYSAWAAANRTVTINWVIAAIVASKSTYAYCSNVFFKISAYAPSGAAVDAPINYKIIDPSGATQADQNVSTTSGSYSGSYPLTVPLQRGQWTIKAMSTVTRGLGYFVAGTGNAEPWKTILSLDSDKVKYQAGENLTANMTVYDMGGLGMTGLLSTGRLSAFVDSSNRTFSITELGAGTYQFSYNTSGLSAGAHTVNASAQTSSNAQITAARSFYVFT